MIVFRAGAPRIGKDCAHTTCCARKPAGLVVPSSMPSWAARRGGDQRPFNAEASSIADFASMHPPLRLTNLLGKLPLRRRSLCED
ncbi:MAG: hypothetical protein WBD40_18885 [Tepidisphaeraceae bacterium]